MFLGEQLGARPYQDVGGDSAERQLAATRIQDNLGQADGVLDAYNTVRLLLLCLTMALRTRNGTTGTTPSQVINNCGITFNHTVNTQIASEACIGYLLVLETLDGSFDSNGSICSRFEVPHGQASGTGKVSIIPI